MQRTSSLKFANFDGREFEYDFTQYTVDDHGNTDLVTNTLVNVLCTCTGRRVARGSNVVNNDKVVLRGLYI